MLIDFDALLDKIEQQSASKVNYEDAPEVEQLAQEMISSYPEFSHVGAARIKYLFRIGNWSKLGECSLTQGKWRKLTGYDYVVVIHKASWDAGSDEWRRALLHHELSHIQFNESRSKWVIRKHDIEEFITTVNRFGAWTPELRALEQVLNHEQQNEGVADKD